MQVHADQHEQHPGGGTQREVREEQGIGAEQHHFAGGGDTFRGRGGQADVDQVRELAGKAVHVCQSPDLTCKINLVLLIKPILLIFINFGAKSFIC